MVVTLFVLLQHGASWCRRSLIEDAKFDTITNAEFQRQERASVTEEYDSKPEEEVFKTTSGNDVSTKKCTVILSVQQMAVMGSLLTVFEVTLIHVPEIRYDAHS